MIEARTNTYRNGLHTALFCVLECGDYVPRFTFENVNKAMIASPNNRLTMICESHPFRIRFDGLSGDERSYEIARIHFINVKPIRHIVNHTFENVNRIANLLVELMYDYLFLMLYPYNFSRWSNAGISS